MKTCSKCKVEKELFEYYKRKDSKDGFRSSCKVCFDFCKKESIKINKDKVNEYYRKYYNNNLEKIKENRDNNKDNIIKSRRKYYENNKEDIKKKSSYRYNSIKDNEISMDRYREMNRKCWLKYRDNNRDEINKKIRDRKKSDPLYKLSFNIRSSISNSIYRMGFSKNDKAKDILGCSFEYFMKYIEEQFEEGMSWDNHGDWHLDHKIPISWANTEEQIYELNKYINFQPLWKYDNLSKGNRYSS